MRKYELFSFIVPSQSFCVHEFSWDYTWILDGFFYATISIIDFERDFFYFEDLSSIEILTKLMFPIREHGML